MTEIVRSARDTGPALDITRGAARCLARHGFASVAELPLANGRRADLACLGRAGEIWIVEVKSGVVDFRTDLKWPEYRDFCDRLLFAVAPDFPTDILPPDTGLILADRFGGELVREAPQHTLSAARRKAMMLRIARVAATRLALLDDPEAAMLARLEI